MVEANQRYDGKPHYCTTCGCVWWWSFINCHRRNAAATPCKLETKKAARARAALARGEG